MISFDLFWRALLLGFIEGITEFLPISSTGHLIVAADLLQFTGEKANTFLIVIQLAAILAVVWEYRTKLSPLRALFCPTSYKNFTAAYTTPQSSLRLGIHLIIAFLPAAVLGVLLHKTIKQVLFHPIPVALALIIGAFFIFILERKHPKPRVTDVDHLTGWDALKIGFAQSLAMIPGTSRAGATIIGGMWFGLSRVAATEFSFFLAIPTMLGATVYDLYKNYSLFSWSDLPLFSVGCISAFFSAWLTIRGLIRYISRHDFVVFAWYRLAFGGVILLTWKLGWVQWA